MRIVSLCPSLTELVFDLGRGDDLVGITEWCVHPAAGVAGIERVGGTKTPDVARITALRPDLVLMNREENRVEDARALERAGIAYHASEPHTVAETAAMVRSIGTRIECEQAARAIADEIERCAEAVRQRVAGSPPVRFAYLIWRRPWMTINGDTFVHSLLALAGGANVFAGHPERYPQIELEELAAQRPDAVLLASEPYAFGEREAAEIASAVGIERRRIHLVDGEDLSWHGSRTPRGIETAARVIETARRSRSDDSGARPS